MVLYRRYKFKKNTSQRGASNSVSDFSVLSNPTGTQKVSYMGLCGKKLVTFNPQLSTFIQQISK